MRKMVILTGLIISIFFINSTSSIAYQSDIPIWATGTISGKWGLREYDILTDFFDGDSGNGMIEYEVGEISGFYGKILSKIYVFQAVFYPYNNHSRISNITGLCYGNLMGGRIGDINIDVEMYNIELSEANYGAFGSFNETSFNWRLMLKTGPTFYLKGDFLKN